MAIALRPSTARDLPFITALERHPDNIPFIGQWSDWEHLSAIDRRNGREHWIIERDGTPSGYLIAYDCRARDAGIYVKRLLVADKEKGTGTQALRQFIAAAFGRGGISCVWLIVRGFNHRAQHVYSKLGFARFDPGKGESERYDFFEEAPDDDAFRMRLAQRTSIR